MNLYSLFNRYTQLFVLCKDLIPKIMSTLEDKILGEKSQYYCSSSSEDEEENDTGESDKEYDDMKYTEDIAQYAIPSYSEWDGTSSNTGPKGVIKVQ